MVWRVGKCLNICAPREWVKRTLWFPGSLTLFWYWSGRGLKINWLFNCTIAEIFKDKIFVSSERNTIFWFFLTWYRRKPFLKCLKIVHILPNSWRYVSDLKHFKILDNCSVLNWGGKTCALLWSCSSHQICGLIFSGVRILAHTVSQSCATTPCASPAQSASSLYIHKESYSLHSNICRADGRTS